MNDFADWLSPIVVKELRQGMRSRAFVVTFLVLQVFMILCVLAALGEESKEGATTFFWLVLGGMLIGLGFRGVTALNGEIKGNTMELLMLTQLSSWRITAGKWAALFLQSVLLACAVLPYVVLRYFLGGVDLMAEMITLGWLLFGSALCTAVAVGASPFMKSPVGGAIAIFGLFNGLSAAWFGRAATVVGATSVAPGVIPLAALLLGPLAILECLEIAIGKIAPLGENHTTRKRLIAGAVLLISIVLGWATGEAALFATLASLIVGPICLGALMEEAPAVPSLYRPVWPFTRPSRLARAAGKFLYPGSASGLLFTAAVACVVLMVVVFGFHYTFDDTNTNYLLVAGLGAVLMPLALIRLFWKHRAPVLFYLGIQIFFSVAAIFLATPFGNKRELMFASLVPTIGFFLQLGDNSRFLQTASLNFFLTSLVTGLSLLVLAWHSVRQWRVISALERKAGEFEILSPNRSYPREIPQ